MPKVLSGGYREDVGGVVAWENLASFVCQWYRYEDGTTHAAGSLGESRYQLSRGTRRSRLFTLQKFQII